MSKIISILTVVVVLLAIGLLLLRFGVGAKLLSVKTASMVPTIQVHDLVITLPLKNKLPNIGEIISYASPSNKNLVVTHRVVRVDPNRGMIVTKGDALDNLDPPFLVNLVIGKVYVRIAKVGYLINSLQKPLGLIIVFYIPALVFVYLELRRLRKYYFVYNLS